MRRRTSTAHGRGIAEQPRAPSGLDLLGARAVLGPDVAGVGQEAEPSLAHGVLPAPLLDLPGTRGGEALDHDGPDRPGQEFEMAAPTLSSETLLHRVRVPPGDRQADQIVKAGLDVGALGVRVGLHVGRGVDDCHVGVTDHDAQLHPVQVAWPERATGPRPLVEQRPDDGEVVAALEDLHRDGAAVDGVLVRARRRPERGESGRGFRHRVIVTLLRRAAPPPPR